MKPDAETIIAKRLNADGNVGIEERWERLDRDDQAFWRNEARELLELLREGGYSLIYGADHKLLKED